ncbi:class I SAM-dependent methyltransferase [Lichenihabitans sp. PAMC28606]|uniref:class I SAM-dependent DNA methyltransferase n=1 Tax=Lichenihabitans sp. PAMC28606 TaxID=2880932 RepID=UPI001D0B025A|nr:class I SAM-dependent methyltransferase [Lichenihabitans sp. PAMC28606]UDL95204.1 class I SAM-dependent methyltransferase [Lichenihabitans sp. PAMC28606]
MRSDTVDLAHFEQLYDRNPDPWRFATSDYERAKYAATIASLPQPRYARGLDVGCSIGVLTAALAVRCDDLLGIEPVEAALDQARQRNAETPWVRFASMFVPCDWPAGPFDLILMSEVIDYLGASDIVVLAGRIRESLAPGGDVVLVHWLGKKRSAIGSGEASDALIQALAGTVSILKAERNADYRIDVLRRV